MRKRLASVKYFFPSPIHTQPFVLKKNARSSNLGLFSYPNILV